MIQLRNTTVYRGHKKVLDDISFAIQKGEHTAIIGPNGAGKSTIVHLLSCEESVKAIQKENSFVELFGQKKYSIWDIKKNIGLITNAFQDSYCHSGKHVSGFDAVCSGITDSIGYMKYLKINRDTKEKAHHYMDTLGIAHLKEKKMGQMSTGQARKILIARSLLKDPKIFALDEPTTGLDPKTRYDLIEYLEGSCSHHGATVLMVTHHAEEILPSITRIIAIKDGVIFFDGKKEEVLTSENISNLFDMPFTVVRSNDNTYQFLPGENRKWDIR